MKIFLVVVAHFCKIDFAAGMPFNTLSILLPLLVDL